MKLLFVEDDRDILKSLLFYFNDLGYTCEKASSLEESREKILMYTYDCIVLDISLPDGSGLEIVKYIKQQNLDVGVLILSANSNLDYKLKGLDLGADDYMTKPFHLSELNARVKSIIRRKKQGGKNAIDFNEISIDTEAKEVRVHGEIVRLTKKEYDLLLYFMFNKNKVVTKSSISEHLWGDFMDQTDSFDSVYSHVKNLKKKLKDKGSVDYISSLYGVGYLMKDN